MRNKNIAIPAFLFFAQVEPEFKFVYFLHLSGYFILPLVILEIFHRPTYPRKGSIQNSSAILVGPHQSIS